MTKKRGPFQFIHSREIYKNPWIQVREDVVIRPDGERGIFGTVKVCPGVSIVPIDNAGYCWLLKEYGYGQGVWHFTLPAGGIEKLETPLQAAKRELLEEVGLASRRWCDLGSVYFYTTFFHIRERLFLALDARRTKSQSNEDKLLASRTFRLPFQDVARAALRGKINSGADVVAILRADHYLRSKGYATKKSRD